jgi:hypothetical protein
MSQPTELSAGALNGSDHLKVELIAPPGKPPFVAINWPTAATITTPASFDQVAATAMRLLAAASVQLAALKVGSSHRPDQSPESVSALGLCHSSASGERQR